MYEDFEDSYPQFLKYLSCGDPDKFTDFDWILVEVYVRSDVHISILFERQIMLLLALLH